MRRGRVLENVDRAKPVVGNVENRIGITGNGGRLCAGVADEFDAGRKIDEILRVAHIAVKEGNSVPLEHGNIFSAAPPNEVIHDGRFVPFFAKMKRDMRTDEPATTGDKNVQEVIPLQDLCGAGLGLPFIQRRKSR